MILPIQIIGILFGLVMLYLTFLYYKKKYYSNASLFLWVFVWIITILVFAIPGTIYGIMDFVNIQRTADFFAAIAIIFLTTIVFYLFGRVKQQEKKMEKLVRKISIEKKK